MVFVNAKKHCDYIAKTLEKSGYSPAILHGGRSQEQRESALAGFKDGTFDILVATDVAGRGLDISGVTHVINYDMAPDVDRYCHRIGRTGRAGKEGQATTLLTEGDSETFFDLKEYLLSTGMEVPRELEHHPMAKVKPGSIDAASKPQKRKDTVIYAK